MHIYAENSYPAFLHALCATRWKPFLSKSGMMFNR